MSEIKKATIKYLQNYAESEANELSLITKSYDYVIVVPICDESPDCLATVFTNIKQTNVLLIVVVNSPIANKVFQQSNQQFISALKSKSLCTQQVFSHGELLQFENFNDVLLIDRNSNDQQINKKQGVGLARKIGADIALRLFVEGKIKQPWIFSTDADVILPFNYFNQMTKDLNHFSAIVLDFEHITDNPKLAKLQELYDFKLSYYLAGIHYAGCAYNYIPLGSTLIINSHCYAQVRGFPKKNAGEDFYLLNKLNKIKPIKYRLNNSLVKIKSRFSNRVPFGTGPALQQINDLEDYNDYRYYHPKCFELLKLWQQFLSQMWHNNQLNLSPPTDKNLIELYTFFACEKVFQKAAKQITSHKRWQQFTHQWFDAFKILKAVHYFDKKYPRQTFKQLKNTTGLLSKTNFATQYTEL